jgi:hypothetical protein
MGLSRDFPDPYAVPRLSDYFDSMICSSSSPADAARFFRMAANSGNVDARVCYAFCLLGQFGVPRNVPEAVRHLKMAADRGSPEADCYLGIMLMEMGSYGVAATMFKNAAKEKFAFGQFLHGYSLLRGVGKTHDATRAAKFFGRAARQGYPLGMTAFGLCQALGLGMRQDEEKGNRWLMKASDRGEPAAMYMQAQFGLHMGAPEHVALAARLLKGSADLGFPPAQMLYAWMCEHGRGIEQDLRKALEYYKLAVDGQYDDAAGGLMRVSSAIGSDVLRGFT